jgi:arylsulfatase A-like enzyme
MKAFLAALLVISASLPLLAESKPRPNILWITTEDIGPHLGCYGVGFAKTPNLDAFAARSQLFLSAWSNAPVCAPARTTIISGMYPPSTGSEHMRSSVPIPEGCKLYPQLLREAGYYCTNNVKEDYNLQSGKTLWNESSKNAHWRNRAEGQPFFAVFNFTTTHESQIRAENRQLSKIDPATITIPAYHPDTPEVRRDWAQYHENIATMDSLFQERLAEMEQAGLADNTIVFFYGDHGSGMPRNKRTPTSSGLRVPLLVHFPERWKHLAPKGYASGAKSTELVSFVDLAPTLLSIIGENIPANMQGRPFCGTTPAPAPEFLHGFRSRMDERYEMVRSATDGRFVYVRHYMPHIPFGQHTSYMFETPTTQIWQRLYEEGKLNEAQSNFWKPKPVEELYELSSDPDEVKNLAADPSHAATLVKLREAHFAHMKRIRDLGFIPEAERLSVAGNKSPRDVFATEATYPFDEIFILAKSASDFSNADVTPFLKAATHPNATMRFWSALGLHIRGSKGVDAGHAVLLKLQQDESPSVRIAATQALGSYGKPEDVPAALETLLSLADCSKQTWHTAVEAFNALDYLDDKALPVIEKIRALPIESPNANNRMSDYLNRLSKKTLRDLEKP